MDEGKEAPDDYFASQLLEFNRLILAAEEASHRFGVRIAPVWIGWSSMIFVRVIQNCNSITTLISSTDRHQSQFGKLDHFSVASIARTGIEACLMIMYLTKLNLSEDELWLRKWILDLHDLTNRHRMFKHMSKVSDSAGLESVLDSSSGLKEYELARSYITGKIVSSKIFLKLDKESRDRILSGQAVFINGLRGAVRESRIDVSLYDYVTSYLSAFVHSHPISFHRYVEKRYEQNNFDEYQRFLCAFSLENLGLFLREATQRMNSATDALDIAQP